MTSQSDPVTPNRARTLRAALREDLASYREARAQAVALILTRNALVAARNAGAEPPLDLSDRDKNFIAKGIWSPTPEKIRAMRWERSINPAEHDAEQAVNTALNRRWFWKQIAKRVSEMRVEVGAAWSPRGLANVRRANRR